MFYLFFVANLENLLLLKLMNFLSFLDDCLPEGLFLTDFKGIFLSVSVPFPGNLGFKVR